MKWSVEPARAADVPLAIAPAYYLAMTPQRRPVLVSVPVDDWDARSEQVATRVVSRSTRPDPATLSKLGDALDQARRPAFVVGGAVDRDEAFDEVVRLAERHQARVFVAPMTGRCNFPEDHALFAGFLPAVREKIVSALEGHDFIFVIGASAFTYHVDGFGPHVPSGAELGQLTEDPQTASWTPVGVAVIGGVRLGLIDLLGRPPPHARTSPPSRSCAPRANPSIPIATAFVLQTLADARPPDSIVVEEAPSARPILQACLPITRSEGFFTMDSGGLGWGLPAAVGVALGKPGRRIVAVSGDGSSLYSIQAIWSAVHWRLPITILILNNHRYAALQDFAPPFGFASQEAVPGTDLPNLDFVAIAAGMGCAGQRADSPLPLHEAFRNAFSTSVPTLIEAVVVDPAQGALLGA